MSGDINDPIEIIFNFDQLQHSFPVSESCALPLFSLEDLQHCQKSGEISLSESDILEDHVRMLSEVNCELVGTTLYGSLAQSYPLIESLFPSDHNIYTTAQSRFLKQRISNHQKSCIYPIYSSRGIILIPIFLLFDFIRLTKLDQSDNSRLRSLRTRFDTFTTDQNNEEFDTTMDDGLSAVVEQPGAEVSSGEFKDTVTTATATVPLDFIGASSLTHWYFYWKIHLRHT